MQLPDEILKKVKLLEISTRKLVNNMFAGEYHTAFKGQGMTFSDFREYVPGDDVRAISWALMARSGKPYIKKFDEERELTMMLVVDISGSADFGSGEYFKGEVMAHLAALLAFSAVKNKDQIGLLLFSDHVEHFVPPGKGRGHVQRILRDLLYFKPQSRKTSLQSTLQHLSGILKKKAVVFVISDFIDTGFDRALRVLGSKHDVVAIVVNDKREMELPDVGLIELQDAETGEFLLVDTSDQLFREEWRKARRLLQEDRDRLLRQSQVDKIEINANDNYVDPLIQYFKNRHLRR
jgi:uncharacterized protein (DUF58 family)